MAEENIITWNFPNSVTIVLMVAIGFTLIGWGAKLWRNSQG